MPPAPIEPRTRKGPTRVPIGRWTRAGPTAADPSSSPPPPDRSSRRFCQTAPSARGASSGAADSEAASRRSSLPRSASSSAHALATNFSRSTPSSARACWKRASISVHSSGFIYAGAVILTCAYLRRSTTSPAARPARPGRIGALPVGPSGRCSDGIRTGWARARTISPAHNQTRALPAIHFAPTNERCDSIGPLDGSELPPLEPSESGRRSPTTGRPWPRRGPLGMWLNDRKRSNQLQRIAVEETRLAFVRSKHLDKKIFR